MYYYWRNSVYVSYFGEYLLHQGSMQIAEIGTSLVISLEKHFVATQSRHFLMSIYPYALLEMIYDPCVIASRRTGPYPKPTYPKPTSSFLQH